MKKKLFSMILCVIMVICFMPSVALANGTEANSSEVTVKQIKTSAELVDAIANQQDNETWVLAAGTYDVKNTTSGSDGTYSATINNEAGGFIFPITANNLTITAEDGADVTITSSFKPDKTYGGVWHYQNFITIGSSGVTIKNIKIKANYNDYYEGVNKVLELIDGGKNLTLENVTFEPVTEEAGTTFTGSIYFNVADVGISVLKNVTVGGWINAKAVTTGTLTIDGLIQDFVGSTYSGYSYDFNDGNGAQFAWNPAVTGTYSGISVSNYTIKVDGKINLAEQIFNENLRDGTTIVLTNNIDLSSGLAINKDITLDFNGQTITSSSNTVAVLIENGANVTFKDSSAGGNGGIKNTYNNNDKANTIKVTGSNTTLTIENGQYISDSLGDVTIVDAVNGATATIKGGTFTAAKDESDATKKEGKVFYSGSDSEENGNQDKHGKVIVTGGTFTGRLSNSNWGVYEISGGTFDRNTVVKYNNPANGQGKSTNTNETITLAEAGMLADGYQITKNGNTFTVSKKSTSSGGSSSGATTDSSSTGTSTGSVVNTTETKTDDSTSGTTTVPETKATVAAETKTAEDGTKTTTATVDTSVATQIVEMAVENKSEEVIIAAAETPVVETAAGTTTEVAIPAEAVSQIAEKTAAAVTIESEAAKVTLDQTAVAAVAEAAGETGNVSLVVETKAQDENKVEVELKLETSSGKVSDFKGGSVSVTVKLNAALADKTVACVYIDDNGNYHKVAGQKNADGTFTFTTGHFSTYAIMSEEEADEVIASQTEKVKELLNNTSLKARSSKTKAGNIKVTLKVNKKNIKAIEDLGYTVTYKFSRSTKASGAYKAKAEKAIKTYTDKTGKKGTKYYYKARVMVYDAQGTLIAKTSLKQCKYASRVK